MIEPRRDSLGRRIVTKNYGPPKVFLSLVPGRWVNEAACANTPADAIDGMFFPPKQGRVTEATRELCAACPVQEQCLEFALAQAPNLFGVWGGFSAAEREDIARMRRGTPPKRERKHGPLSGDPWMYA